MKHKIAFLFLLYDGMNHEKLWHEFFKNHYNDSNIYIYSQKESKLLFFKEHVLDIDLQTQYWDSSIVAVQNDLLSTALKNEENTHFIFLSGACIPVKSFDYIYQALDQKYSYFNICPDSQVDRIPREYRDANKEITFKKASQWCILNNKHAKYLVENDDYLNWIDFPYIAPDEHCYISKLFTWWFKNELQTTDNLSIWATTFTNWSDVPYKYNSNHEELKNYHHISGQEISYIIESKSFFARKFLQWCTVDDGKELWEDIVNKCKI